MAVGYMRMFGRHLAASTFKQAFQDVLIGVAHHTGEALNKEIPAISPRTGR
jgi:hypothetical protein